eukprot:m.384503 g.384503  ORF g.384503 m.384503 type:complete len:118 (+) comp16734_c6_seq1:265-618(+)
MADGSDAAAGVDGAELGDAVYAAAPADVTAVLQRLQQNDRECTSVVLNLRPPYRDIVEQLANAIRGNSFLTSLKLVLEAGDTGAIVAIPGAVDTAVATNSSITVLDVWLHCQRGANA